MTDSQIPSILLLSRTPLYAFEDVQEIKMTLPGQASPTSKTAYPSQRHLLALTPVPDKVITIDHASLPVVDCIWSKVVSNGAFQLEFSQDHFPSPLGCLLAVVLLALATVMSTPPTFFAPYKLSLEVLVTPEAVPTDPGVFPPTSRDPLT